MVATIATEWHNHTKSKPCPVCGKPDRCQYTDDGAHRCFRNEGAVAGWTLASNCADGTGVYRAGEQTASVKRNRSQPAHRSRSKKASVNWARESERFKQELTPERLDELAKSLGVHADALTQLDAGLATETELRRLQVHGQGWDINFPEHAFSFPERDGTGKIAGICFRAPDGRKGAAKGSHRGLTVPANFKSMAGPILVVEGASDVAALITMGIAAIGRPSNTGGADYLAAYLADQDIVVLGENDKHLTDGGKMEWPGREGAISIANRLASAWDKPIRVSMPPKNSKDVRSWFNEHCKDPNDAVTTASLKRQLMPQVLDDSQVIQPTPPDLVFRVDQDPKRKRATVRAVVNGKVVATDDVKLTSDKQRGQFARLVADKDKRLKPDDIEKKLHGCVNGEGEISETKPPANRTELIEQLDAQNDEALAQLPVSAIRQAEAMLDHPELIDAILIDMASIGIVGEQELTLQVYMVGTSRLLPKPISAIVQGLSSTGKSYVSEKVSSVFPDEVLLRATDLTPQCLFYMQPGRLIHRWVVAGERSRRPDDERAESTRALREMQSGGRLSKALPMKIGGRMETIVVEQEGPIAFTESTTITNIFDEDANRCLLLGTDESPEQTARIIAATAEAARSDPPDVSAIIARHKAIQLLLRRVRVKIPFANLLAASMPIDRPEGRRAITHTLSMIEAVALVHQRQRSDRELHHGDTIEATLHDYCIARRLLIGPLGRALGGALPEAVRNLGKRLLARYGNSLFTAPQAASEDPIIKSGPKTGEYLQTLRGAGTAELVDEGRGNKPHVWRMLREPPEAGAKWLPERSSLEKAT